jgi:3',5'-cyclic AMP phosphodiesterase CpdA
MVTQSIRFAQLSDIHLMANPTCRCWWMTASPENQLQQAINQLNTIPDLDFVVFTGDLVDQADPASLAQFQKIVSQLQVPYFISIGNHDFDCFKRKGRLDRYEFLQWCRQQFAFEPAATGLADYSLAPLEGIRLIALDASLGTFPDPQGVIRPIQLEWLQDQLQLHARDAVILLIHQPPVASVFFRKYRVLPEQAAPLCRLLELHGQVIAVLSGHLHVPKVYVRRRIPYLVAPPLVGPVSAFRLFELEFSAHKPQAILRYHWHKVHLTASEPPSPLWHGLVMGHPWDRHGELSLPIQLPQSEPVSLQSY